jgi:hypothetical protein
VLQEEAKLSLRCLPKSRIHRQPWLGIGFKKVDRGRGQGDGAAAAEVSLNSARGCQMIDTDKVSPYLKEKHQGHLISWNEWTIEPWGNDPRPWGPVLEPCQMEIGPSAPPQTS